MPVSAAELAELAAAREVIIETRAGNRVFPTVIWVAVGKDDNLYVRSFLGDAGRWYRRVLADPEVTIIKGDTRVAFRAVPATDDDSVKAASDAFVEKYPKGSSLEAMILPEVLHTTLRLEPAD